MDVIPNEILSRILLLLRQIVIDDKQGDWRKAEPDWVGIMQVCRRWYSVVEGNPRMWAQTIDRCRSPNFLARRLSLAKAIPCDLFIGRVARQDHSDDEEDSEDGMTGLKKFYHSLTLLEEPVKTMEKHKNHLRSVTLFLNFGLAGGFLKALAKPGTSALQVLRVYSCQPPREEGDYYTIAILDEQVLPNETSPLEVFISYGLPVKWSILKFRGLRVLKVTTTLPFRHISIKRVVAALREMPQLEDVHLDAEFITGERSGGPVELPLLRVLVVCGEWTGLNSFLRLLVLPHSVSLMVAPSGLPLDQQVTISSLYRAHSTITVQPPDAFGSAVVGGDGCQGDDWVRVTLWRENVDLLANAPPPPAVLLQLPMWDSELPRLLEALPLATVTSLGLSGFHGSHQENVEWTRKVLNQARSITQLTLVDESIQPALAVWEGEQDLPSSLQVLKVYDRSPLDMGSWTYPSTASKLLESRFDHLQLTKVDGGTCLHRTVTQTRLHPCFTEHLNPFGDRTAHCCFLSACAAHCECLHSEYSDEWIGYL